jgi:SAM-dependent methyltransferase
MKQTIKRLLPDSIKKILFRKQWLRHYVPPPGKVQKGDFNRLTPFSTEFGYDRGGPVDRVYIESFLEKERAGICGNVLEIGDNDYTIRFGGSQVTKSDVLHVDPANLNATIIADLANAPEISNDRFDCIILTQTLHLIYDFHSAIRTCYRILKPGGRLLLTVPGITPLDHGTWNESWYWSFTLQSMTRVMHDNFKSDQIQIQSCGNVLTATAFLYGLGKSELTNAQLAYQDRCYPVIITVSATK